MSANSAAADFTETDPAVQRAVDALIARVQEVDPQEAEETERQLRRLTAHWAAEAGKARNNDQVLHYRGGTRQIPSLLQDFGAEGSAWDTLHSMRNVDRQCSVDVMGEQR